MEPKLTINGFSFTLFPLGELNFQVIPVGQSVVKEVILTNTSKCPITYKIEIPEKYSVAAANTPAESDEEIKRTERKTILEKKKDKDTKLVLQYVVVPSPISRTPYLESWTWSGRLKH